MNVQGERSRTVKLIIFDEDDRLLLTHELEEKNGKPKGTSLPGGGVEPDRIEQFTHIIDVEALAKNSGITAMELHEVVLKGMDCQSIGIDRDAFITAVQEAITETGFLVLPLKLLFIDPILPDHEVWVVSAKVKSGHLKRKSLETDDCGWYPIDQLPFDLYHRDHYRIIRGLEIIGRKDLVAQLNFECNKEEESYVYAGTYAEY